MKKTSQAVWSAPEKLNIAQLALLCKLDRRTVAEKLQQANISFEPGTQRGKIYVVAEALPAIYGRLSKGAAEVESEAEEEKLLLLKAKREKAQVELAEKLRELVPLDMVLGEISKEYTFLRARLRSIPNSISKVLALQTDPAQIFNVLTKSIDDALAELKADAETLLEELPEDIEEIEQDDLEGDNE